MENFASVGVQISYIFLSEYLLYIPSTSSLSLRISYAPSVITSILQTVSAGPVVGSGHLKTSTIYQYILFALEGLTVFKVLVSNLIPTDFEFIRKLNQIHFEGCENLNPDQPLQGKRNLELDMVIKSSDQHTSLTKSLFVYNFLGTMLSSIRLFQAILQNPSLLLGCIRPCLRF